MKLSIGYFLTCIALSLSQAREVESSWVFVPDENNETMSLIERPWRIVVYDDSTVESHTLFFGCKNPKGTGLSLVDDVISIPFNNGEELRIRKEKDRLVLKREFPEEAPFDSYECVFVKNEEWDRKFEKAPPRPQSREEALQTLDIILSKEDKNSIRGMSEGDLLSLHFGFGMALRNGFGLWNPDSQIVKDYGGGHPDGISNMLIKEYWERLNKKAPSQTPQTAVNGD